MKRAFRIQIGEGVYSGPGGRKKTPQTLLMARYRDLTQVFGKSSSILTLRVSFFLSKFNALSSSHKSHYLSKNRRPFTHKRGLSYRAFTHIFTVFSPTFLSKNLNSLSNLYLKPQEVGQLDSLIYSRTTALSPIKLPLFHTCTYRTFTQSSTVLSTREFFGATALSTIKVCPNPLELFDNSVRKVVLKDVYKKIIRFLMMLFFLKLVAKELKI